MRPKWQKKTLFCHPTVAWRPIATQPPRISPWTLYRVNVDSVGYISAADSVRLSSFKFSGGLRKPHDWRRGVRIGPSRSSEVDDFRVIWKALCDFLLVINSNLSSISHRFWDRTTYRFIIANFPYPPLFSPKFENVAFALDRWNFAHGERRHWAN